MLHSKGRKPSGPVALLGGDLRLCKHARVLRRMRKLGFILVAGWMLLSPAYVQVFGGRAPIARDWRMFHLRGQGICSAVYFAHDRQIDRYALFGLERRSAPTDFRRITGEDQARAVGRRICEKLRRADPSVDVRVTLRCGVMEGLQTLLDRQENLCDG